MYAIRVCDGRRPLRETGLSGRTKMPKCTKQVARELHWELQEVMAGILDQIDQTSDDGPVLTIICEGLGKAIAALKTKA